jgi:hypothetical protein
MMPEDRAFAIGLRIVEAIGADVEIGDALAALRLVSLWFPDRVTDPPRNEIVTCIVEAIGPDASPGDAVAALQFVITWLVDRVTEPRDVTSRGGARN